MPNAIPQTHSAFYPHRFVLSRFVLVCLAVISHRFYTYNTTVWVVECDKFETFFKCLPSGDPTIHCVFKKKTEKNRPWLIIIPFKIYLQSFPIQKLSFFSFLSLSIKVEKVFKDYFNVAQFGNHGQTMPTIIVSWSKLLGARVAMAQYQQEFCRKFTPSEQV